MARGKRDGEEVQLLQSVSDSDLLSLVWNHHFRSTFNLFFLILVRSSQLRGRVVYYVEKDRKLRCAKTLTKSRGAQDRQATRDVNGSDRIGFCLYHILYHIFSSDL